MVIYNFLTELTNLKKCYFYLGYLCSCFAFCFALIRRRRRTRRTRLHNLTLRQTNNFKKPPSYKKYYVKDSVVFNTGRSARTKIKRANHRRGKSMSNKRKTHKKRKTSSYSKGELNRLVDSVLHPLYKKNQAIRLIDGAVHALIEQDLPQSTKKFLQYNLPELAKKALKKRKT